MSLRVLIADDEALSRRLLEGMMKKWGYGVVVAHDGDEAWKCIQQNDAPRLALLDWNMPEPDGVEICRCVRSDSALLPRHIILLTAREDKRDIIEGLLCGSG